MSEYEKYNLLLQALTTIATLGAVVGIYYAGKSFALSKADFERKLKIESDQYIYNIIKEIKNFETVISKIKTEKLTVNEISKDFALLSSIRSALNYFEMIQLSIDHGLYDKVILKTFIQEYALRIHDVAIPLIHFKRQEWNNPNLLMGAERLIEEVLE